MEEDDPELPAAELMRAAEEAAAARGREMVEEARTIRRRMLEDATQRRDLVRAELERVRRTIDDALSALDAVDTPHPATSRPSEPAADAPAPAREPPADADRRVEDAFAALRRVGDAPTDPAPSPEPEPEPEPAPEPAPDARPASEPQGQADDPELTGDAAARARRNEVLAALLPDVLRASKRLLQDEQNTVLDAGRRARKSVEPSRLLPEPAHHQESWAEALRPSVDVAYSSGRTAIGRRRKPVDAPQRLLSELAGTLVMPLRERLITTIGDVAGRGPYASPAELHRELSSAVGARYREWKGGDLEVRLQDALAAAYARGTYDATPRGTQLRWIPDQAGRCPDCDDNALEPTLKGRHFPTGQSHPPAHPGCRCIVVPLAPDATAEFGA